MAILLPSEFSDGSELFEAVDIISCGIGFYA